MKTLYHATDKENVYTIISQGLKAGIQSGGVIYFCETINDALTYSLMYNPSKQFAAVIPVEFTDDEFNAMEKNFDNDAGSTPDAFAYFADIVPSERIPHNLNDIPLYRIGS